MKTKKLNILWIVIAIVGFSFSSLSGQMTTTEFDVNGLKVIHKKVPKEVVSVRMFVKGGTANYEKEQEGIESLAFAVAMRGGTKSKDKIAFNTAAESVGAQMYSASDYDFGSFGLTCLKQYWDESWNLFSDAIMNPAFDQKEFDLIQKQSVTQAQQAESNADSHLRNLAMSNVFKGMNYEKIPEGTVASLEKMTVDQVAEYYKNILGKDRSFLVVVGNVDQADLKQKIKSSLATLPKGTMPEVEERAMINEPGDLTEERDIATNYIRGYMDAPKAGEADGVPMMMAMSILRDRYFVELRTKRGLTYAPGAFYAGSIINNPYSAVYISTTDPVQSMDVMVNEINSLKEDGFEQKELVDKQQTFLTWHYMGLETMSQQANSLGMAELNGDWRLADQLTDKVNAVSLEDLNRMADKYMNTIRWTYLGDVEKISEESFIQPVKP